jgi:hypothetical protein
MKKWVKKAFFLLAGVGMLALLPGCYPDNNLTVDQATVVSTGYNDSVNFQNLHTYYMPDTILVRRADTSDHTPVENQKAYLAEVAKEMQAMGYQRLTLQDTALHQVPDVDLIVSAIEQNYVAGGWYQPWYPDWGFGWDWYGPWFPGWGWYYPPSYYPPLPWFTTYKTGTLLMEMVNPRDYDIIRGDTVSRVYWNAALNGLLQGSDIKARVLAGIDQAFKQSPEIRTSSK